MPKAVKETKTTKATRKPRTTKAKKDPNEPKKPLSSFMLFSSEQRAKIKEENPEFSFGEIGKEVGARWRALNDAEKKVYKDRELKEKAKYATAIEEFNKKDKKKKDEEEEEADAVEENGAEEDEDEE
ncbi:Non-histone chromosomal protein 6 [Nowakowskiella sp. JEL0078]|nr:Non-histone chromosomal protein 6 [Nowakowskiella sp. JEL0078]